MADTASRPTYEKVEGTWNGRTVSINKEFRGKDLTQDELNKLFANEQVILERTSKEGKPYKVKAYLADAISPRGTKYVRVEAELYSSYSNKVKGVWNGREIAINPVYRGERLSDEQLRRLFDGQKIRISRTSKAGKPYDLTVWISDQCEYNGRKYTGIDSSF
jgi:hypothetical protein